MSEKRKRSQNVTIDEKDRLVKLLMEHRDTILNKKTDGTTNEAKAIAWKGVTDSFNSTGSIYRSKESLMKIWEKLKSDSKIYFTMSRRNSTQTGGGPSIIKIDPILEQVCAVLGRGCTGIIGVPDSDFVPGTPMIPICEYEGSQDSQSKVVITNELDVPIDSIILESEEVLPSDLSNVESKQKNLKQDELVSGDIIRKTPLWSRRRPILSQTNERTEVVSSLCNSFKDVNRKKEHIEDLKRQLLQDEIDFKKKLYKLQLLSAEKELEIKQEVLQQIRGGALQLGQLFGVQQKPME